MRFLEIWGIIGPGLGCWIGMLLAQWRRPRAVVPMRVQSVGRDRKLSFIYTLNGVDTAELIPAGMDPAAAAARRCKKGEAWGARRV